MSCFIIEIKHAYGQVNKYLNSIYYYDKLWIDKIHRKHNNFPVMKVLNDEKLPSLLLYEGGQSFVFRFNIRGLYAFLSEKSADRLNQMAAAIFYTDISRWLLHEHNIGTRRGIDHLSCMIKRGELDYLKFYCEECVHDISFELLTSDPRLYAYEKAIFSTYKYSKEMFEYLLKYNSAENEIMVIIKNNLT